MSLETKEDWQEEIRALFHYLEVERGLTPDEGQALIRLLYRGSERPVSQS